ncbi:uncharacterized protein EAE97_001226 [Botrytis byssoidea]|uniref:DUF7918 domain-containing protein n=1 Tax=Botrytis byssoidea TaxID=139641 RepID=A0A9P5M677_9HELO|nr:uncharacterized protein EAE97_001226 [Botrytis byssoidea]KAF7953827.1 hypothetical protein EAE97_001226 [Botrytis byssoidea]
MAILKSVPGIEVSICFDNEPLIEYIDRSAKADRSTILKYVEVVPDKEFTIRITTDKSYKWTSPYVVLDIIVDGVEIRTLPYSREEFEQECQASSSHVHNCIGSYGIENEQEVVGPFKFSKLSVSHVEELRDEIENDVSRFKKTGEVKVGLYRAKSVKKLSATQARKHCPTFWKQPELNDDLMKDVHWDAISRRLESQSHIANLGPAKPAGEDPCIRTVYDAKYMDFDRSRSVKPQGVFKLRYRSEESLKSLLIIRWDDAEIKGEPMIKIESGDEDVVEKGAEDVTESVVKRERDEDLVESSMPAIKRARSRRNKT